MTPDEEALTRVVSGLERFAIPYILTGSLATSYYGRPRATHDADIVIDPSPDALDSLLRDLAADCYADSDVAREALRGRRTFKVIDSHSASKIDLIIRKNRPFSHEEFRRRRHVDLWFRAGVAIVSAEDAIVSKLEWARLAGDSERQLRDAAGVLEINDAVDRDYIVRWATELGVADLWERISRRA